MDDLVKCLYEFVQTHRMGSLYQDEEYEEYSKCVQLQEERVRGFLDEQQQRELRLLMENVSSYSAIENEHLFQAALTLSQELNALLRA